MMANDLNPREDKQDAETPGDLLKKTLLNTTGRTLGWATSAVSEILGLVGALQYVDAPSAASIFVAKLIFFHHDDAGRRRLQHVVHQLKGRLSQLQGTGALIDFSDSRNLEGLFYAIEDVMEAREDAKAELFCRVLTQGLIEGDAAGADKRDYGYAIKALEMEDIDILHRVNTLRNGNLATEGGASVVSRDDLGNPPEIRLARLAACGIIEDEVSWSGTMSFQFTNFGLNFYAYLESLRGGT